MCFCVGAMWVWCVCQHGLTGGVCQQHGFVTGLAGVWFYSSSTLLVWKGGLKRVFDTST